MSYYVNQNWDLFWMVVQHFKVEFSAIERIDRRTRTALLEDGTVLTLPDDWNLS